MKTTLLILAGAAALSLAACNKPAPETATDTAMEATPAPAEGAAMGASTPGAASTGAMTTAKTSTTARAGGSASESMTPAANSTMTPMLPNASANPTAQETIAATKDTLSPAGASSGPTAPAPKH